MYKLWNLFWNEPRYLRWGLSFGLVLAGIVMGAEMRGLIVLDWQRMYRPEEFTQLGDLGHFLAELQTGISPVWSSLEILSQLVFGTTAPFSRIIYPLCLILVALLPLWLFARRRWEMWVIAGLSLLFMLVTRVLAKGNPQMYDLYFPALTLGYLGLLQRLRNRERSWGNALAAGLLLAILELTRTFALALFPVLLIAGLVVLRQFSWRHFLAFLVPILVLSGGWHLKQVVAHDHFHWTNHGGFNLYKVWHEFTPELNYEPLPPRYEGGFPNINTDVHSQRNKEVTALVAAGIKDQPLKATTHVAKRLVKFYRPKTDLYLASLPSWLEWLYRPVIWILGLLLLGLTVRLLVLVFRAPFQAIQGRSSTWSRIFAPGNMLVFAAAGASFLCAVGESGEEARFMLSILPLLAGLPGVLGRIIKGDGP